MEEESSLSIKPSTARSTLLLRLPSAANITNSRTRSINSRDMTQDEEDLQTMLRAVETIDDSSIRLSPSGVSLITDYDEEEIVFEKKDHGACTFPRFDTIRRDGQLCDVRIRIDESIFSAHRVVLAATIPYFRAMFCSNMLESHQDEIVIGQSEDPASAIDADTMESLIQYAYTGKLQISTRNVQNLMLGAAYLSLNDIVAACAKYLQQRLQASNVLSIRSFAQLLNSSSLINAVDRYIQKHFIAVSKSDDFVQLPLNELLNLLERDGLHVSNEEQVFDAAMRWIDFDQGRDFNCADILARVRLPLLKPAFLSDVVAADARLKQDLRCRDLIDEAKDYHLMPERRSLMHTFRTKARCCNDVAGIIYAVGGLSNSGDSMSTVEMFDPLIGRWMVCEPMSTLRSRVGVTVMNGQLFAIGGFNGYERLRTVEVFDTKTRRWREMPSLINKRSALGACVINDRVYVCGGYDGITSLATCEFFDNDNNQWLMMPKMTKQRSAAGIAVIDHYIYIMGGHDGTSIFSTVERFDTNTMKWEMVAPMNSRRCRLGACALNGKLYACGGYDGSTFLSSVECYDPETNNWHFLESMQMKRSRVSLVANCARLYAIGGYDGNMNLVSTEIYSFDEGTWLLGPPMAAHEGGVGIGVVPTGPGQIYYGPHP